MEITKEILSRSVQQVADLLDRHQGSINQSFEAGNEILEIPIKLRYTFVDGKLKIVAKTNFVKDRVKDDLTSWYDPDQKQLFDESDTGD